MTNSSQWDVKSAGGGAGVSGQSFGCDLAGHSLCARAHTGHMAGAMQCQCRHPFH